MKIAMTGATGLLGGNLAVEASKAGYEVRATKRSTSQTSHLDAWDIDWHEASLSDTDAMTKAFDGCDVVFHCAAAVSIQFEVKDWIHQANIEGTRNVLRAVQEADVGRLVHCSTVGAIGLSTDGEPCDETQVWNMPDFGLGDAYVTTKFQSQRDVLDAAEEGLDALVVNPTYMIGPYDPRPSSGEIVVQLVQQKLPGYTLGKNNFVDVRDVARGMLAAAKKGKRGEKYILGGRNMTYKKFFDVVCDVARIPRINKRMSPLVASIAGKTGDLYARVTNKEPLLNSATVRWGHTPRFIFTSEKAERELGYEISPLEPAIEDAITWFQQHDMIS